MAELDYGKDGKKSLYLAKRKLNIKYSLSFSQIWKFPKVAQLCLVLFIPMSYLIYIDCNLL